MGNEKFSRRDAPPTDYEVRLLQNATGDSVWLDIARKLMADHGVEAGARALLVVLDALGTEKVHVPARETLFRKLYRKERDDRVLELLDRGEQTAEQIAQLVDRTPARISQIVKRSGRAMRRKRVGKRA